MPSLALALYLLIGPTLAGVFVLIGLTAPELGVNDLESIGRLAGAGFLAGLPPAVILAWSLSRKARRAA